MPRNNLYLQTPGSFRQNPSGRACMKILFYKVAAPISIKVICLGYLNRLAIKIVMVSVVSFCDMLQSGLITFLIKKKVHLSSHK